jgi:hypothetical protein
MFYKNEGTGNGIKKAVSDYVNRDYQQYSNQYYQKTSSAVEGSCVFKLYDSDTYILMYDVYTSGRYEFTTSSDLENFSVKSGISMDFTARHGTVFLSPGTKPVDWWNNGATASIPSPRIRQCAVACSAEQDLLLWPLPAGEQLHFRLNGNSKARQAPEVLVVTGLDGRVWIREPKARNNSLDCSSLPAGSYILRLETEDRTHRAVFIKK